MLRHGAFQGTAGRLLACAALRMPVSCCLTGAAILLSLAILLAPAGCAPPVVRPQSGDHVIKFSRQGYEALFTHGILHDIVIVMSRAEWQGMLQDMRTYARNDPAGRPLSGNYRRATFIYRGPAGDAIIEDVGFRTKGHFSRPYPQDQSGDFHRAHFKIKFNEEFDLVEGTPEYEERNQRRFAKLRELELRMPIHNANTGAWDTTQIRELYAYELMRRAGVNTSRTGAARLTIVVGGQRHYFGIYTLIEPIDKSFLTKRYGSAANDGNLYKCLWGDSGPANLGPIDDPSNFKHPLASDPRIVGVKDWRSHYRPTYDLKTNTDAPDHSELLDFIDKINSLSGDSLKEYLEANFEVDRFLRYLAMNFLIGKWDDYWAIGNNYYLYFNNAGKIEFFPVDYDMAFGDGFALFDTAHVGIYEWGNRNRELLELLAPDLPPEVLQAADLDYPLVEKMFQIAEYRQRYEAYLKEFITPANRLFVFSEFEREFNQAYAAYAPFLDNDMGEGTEMYINDRVKRYYYEKTKSVIAQLGLNEADYEFPELPEPAEKGPIEELPAHEYGEELSFVAREVRNDRYGFSLSHPWDWRDITDTQLYEAIAPSQVTGLFVSRWPASWGDSLAEALPLAFREGPVDVRGLGHTALADGTPAEIAEYRATIVGYRMHLYSIAVKRDTGWISVNLWNIDGSAPFDRDLFEEIAHTLRFEDH